MMFQEYLDANKETIGNIFSVNRFYIIPPFQRRFVWQRENFQKLIEDLWEAFQSGRNYYFLGSIVLSKTQGAGEAYQIIDGQQRLTTLSLLFVSFIYFIKNKGFEVSNDYLENLRRKIYSPANEVDGIPEDFRIKYEIPEAREESEEYKNILRASNINLENINYKNFREALEVFVNFLEENIKDFNTLRDCILFLNTKTLIVEIISQEIETAINIFNVINSRGLPLSNSDLIKSYIYGKIHEEDVKIEFIKKWEELESNFSKERYGQSEFDALLGFIRAYYEPQKPKESLYKEIERIVNRGDITPENFKDVLVNLADLYESLIKDLDKIDELEIDGDKKNYLKNLIIILREFYPSNEWIAGVLWFYKKYKGDKFFEFMTALERRLYLDWLSGKTPTERLIPIYDVLKKLKEGKNAQDIIENLIRNIPPKERVEIFLNDENIYSRFQGKLAKYTLLRIEYHNQSRNILNNTENITIEHIFPQRPNDAWKRKFGDDWEKYVNKLGNLTLVERRLNSKMSNKPFEEKKKILRKRGREFFLNEEIQKYNDWTKQELENRHKDLTNRVLNIYYPT